MKLSKKVLKGLGATVIGVAIGTGIFVSLNDDDLFLESVALEPVEEIEQEENDKKETINKKMNEEKVEKVEKVDKKVSKVSKAGNKKEETYKKESSTNGDYVEKEKVVQGTSKSESTKEVKSEAKLEAKKDVITTKTSTSTEAIAFKTVRQNDNSLEKGKEVLVQEGKDGVRTITYKETYKNGSLASKEVVGSKTTQQPINKIVKVGTKERTVSNASTILINAGFAVAGNQYSYITDLSGVVVQVTLNNSGKVTKITFDGTSYYTWKSIPKDLLVSELGKEEGTKEYNAMQKDMSRIESAIQAAAKATGNSSLYYDILKGGASTSIYTKTF